jgi:biopolymer transport protein ExbD
MAFGGFGESDNPVRNAAPMSDINMTPLIDVMLVLLVIFIITAPLLTRAVKLDLPRAAATAAPDTAQTIVLSIDAKGQLFWDREPISETGLRSRFAAAGKQAPAPEIHLRADRSTRYETIARVMADAQRAGLSRIGFVTLPESGGPDDSAGSARPGASAAPAAAAALPLAASGATGP